MTQPAVGSDRTAGDYGHLARRRWLSILVGVLIGVLLALAYLTYATPTYVSTASVLVNPVSTDTSASGTRTAETVNLDTEAQLATSFDVASRAGDILGSTRTPIQLAADVTATVPPNTTVLDIAYAATSATGAQQGAQAFAQAYVDNRQATAQQAVNAETRRVRGVIDQLSKQLNASNKKLNNTVTPPSQAEQAALVTQRDALNAQLSAASVTLTSLRGTVVQGSSIIVDAQRPGSKTSPNPFLVIPSGAVAGLLLGLALAVFRDRSDQRIHRAADVERLFGLPVLATSDTSKTSGVERSPSVQHDMRALYHALVAPNPDGPVVALLVGSGSTAANQLANVLSRVSARSGSLTTLVRSQSGPDGAEAPGPGLEADLELLDYTSLEIVVDNELRSHTLTTVLNGLRQHRDLVVLEMPTNDRAVDLPGLGHSVDVVVVVVELGRTTRNVVHEILEDLRRSTARQVVAVSLRARRRVSAHA